MGAQATPGLARSQLGGGLYPRSPESVKTDMSGWHERVALGQRLESMGARPLAPL